MPPARELRLNTLMFPHALEGKRSLERIIVVMYRSFASTMPCNNSYSSFRSLSYKFFSTLAHDK